MSLLSEMLKETPHLDVITDHLNAVAQIARIEAPHFVEAATGVNLSPDSLPFTRYDPRFLPHIEDTAAIPVKVESQGPVIDTVTFPATAILSIYDAVESHLPETGITNFRPQDQRLAAALLVANEAAQLLIEGMQLGDHLTPNQTEQLALHSIELKERGWEEDQGRLKKTYKLPRLKFT
jgi:hypothetical protein